ncbi:hypothetical protein [Rhodobacter calidifons]|uniref:Uncharacterized protein n=1 Tax=Rhodobacter calidifons TaxID=2715277 RepID=A0ABX0GAZ5_9RHOB|nr:hypothetical protein [Rhodobacter calidifons]NHB78490.1 hypothetical protein [Rhodobacter calidifons]
MSARVAEVAGRLTGLAHSLFHRLGRKIEEVCLLHHLFTAPTARCFGRAQIKAVDARADAADAPAVHRLTQRSATSARRPHDRIGQATPFIRDGRKS